MNENIVKVYWQPGCSSCLKTKEFLKDNGVEFKSVNVLEDKSGFEDLQRFGVKLVPVVAKGDQWANGAVFRDVAKVAGFNYSSHKMLDPKIMVDKVKSINFFAREFLEQIPEDKLDTLLPGRPRSYRQLVYHVFNIPDVFLDRVEHNKPYTYEALLSNTIKMEKKRDPYWLPPLIVTILNKNSKNHIDSVRKFDSTEFSKRLDGFYYEPDNYGIFIMDAIKILNLRELGNGKEADLFLIQCQKKYLKDK